MGSSGALLKLLNSRKVARNIAHPNCLSRFFKTKSESLVYSEHGDPDKVLR